ncbi:hypothetical protein [Collimonas humicola]|uniref:hypothetical protein n=1 Tax=Collimonas humicola TaxID=2825886 RepID=UPI001B8C8B23|nr:hypothetical protein [Collimonas humicola]
MNERRINWELCVGVCGIVIAVASVFFTYRQSEMTKQHDRISVQPRITLTFQIDRKRDRQGWYMSNNGLGPAYFTGFQLFIDDMPIQSKFLGGWAEALKKLNVQVTCFSVATTPPRTSLSNGPSVDEPLLRLNTAQAGACDLEFAKLYAALNRIKVKIDYQSIYGDNFSVTDSPYQPI